MVETRTDNNELRGGEGGGSADPLADATAEDASKQRAQPSGEGDRGVRGTPARLFAAQPPSGALGGQQAGAPDVGAFGAQQHVGVNHGYGGGPPQQYFQQQMYHQPPQGYLPWGQQQQQKQKQQHGGDGGLALMQRQLHEMQLQMQREAREAQAMREHFEQKTREADTHHRQELARSRERDEYTDAGSERPTAPSLGLVIKNHPDNELKTSNRRFRVSGEQERALADTKASLSDQRQTGRCRELARHLADIVLSLNDNLQAWRGGGDTADIEALLEETIGLCREARRILAKS